MGSLLIKQKLNNLAQKETDIRMEALLEMETILKTKKYHFQLIYQCVPPPHEYDTSIREATSTQTGERANQNDSQQIEFLALFRIAFSLFGYVHSEVEGFLKIHSKLL